MNIFHRLLSSKHRIFYDLFEKAADNAALMADKLMETIAEPEFNKRAAILQQMEDLEHANDDLTHDLFTQLGRNYITPFDREDIHFLASALDDIIDYTYSSAKKMNIYRVDPSDDGIQKLASIVEQSTHEVQIAIKELRNMKKVQIITDALVKINSLENEADDQFDLSIDMLFQKEQDAKEVIKKREIYLAMEEATDKCEDAANVIESIIIKYA